MSIVKYETLLKVAETGNITKAADQLGYTQSGVSQMLNSLESELELTLLNRNKGGVTLTSAGEKLLPYLREAVNSDRRVKEMAGEIKGLKAGFIRIGSVTSVSVNYLPQKIKEFNMLYPHINFELLQGDYSEIEEWVKNGTVDCGFIVSPSRLPLETITLFTDPIYLITAKEHCFKNKKTVSMGDLKEEAFVFTDVTDYDFTNLFKKAGFYPKVRYTTENDYATIAMVEQGLGVAMIPDLILKNFKRNLCIKQLDIPSFRTICLAVRSLKQASPPTRTFIEFLKSSVPPSDQSK